MCGIFGIIYYGRNHMVVSELNDVKELVANLLSASQSRGTDASGICMVTRHNKALTLRHHTPGKNLVLLPQYAKLMDHIGYTNNFKYMLGHTRAKTQGTERNNINNHPIITEKVIGVHNGAINNDHQLFRMYDKSFDRDGQVDSEIIFKLLDHHIKDKNSLVDATKKTAKSIIGWYSCAFIHTDHPNYMTLFGSDSASIVIHDIKSSSIMVFASTDKIITDAADSITRFRYPSSKLEVGKRTGIRINTTNGKMYTFSIEANESYSAHHGYGAYGGL